MSNQFGTAAVDITGAVDKLLTWAAGSLGATGDMTYSTSSLADDLARLIRQSAAKLGWKAASGRSDLDIAFIDGSEAKQPAQNDRESPYARRLHVFFAFADSGELASEELLPGYSQLFKGKLMAATSMTSEDGNMLAIAVITSAAPADARDAACWELVDALNAFGSFKLSHLSRYNRRLGEALSHSAKLIDEMLGEVTAHTSARVRERHSLKEIGRNLKREILDHRLRKQLRPPIVTKEQYFRSASGKLLKEAGKLAIKPRAEGSLLHTLALSAVRPRCALYIGEDHTFGGLEQWVCDFAHHIRRNGYVPYLVVRGTPTFNSRVTQEFPGEVLYLHNDAQALADLTKQCRFDALVVNHVYDGVKDIPPPCRVVEILHNIYFWQLNETPIAEARERVDSFIAVSEEVAQYSRRYLNLANEKLHVVPHGLNVVNLYRPPRGYLEKARRNISDFRVLFVGNLYPQKNVICLIEAFAQFKSKAPNATLRLAGALTDASYGASIQRAIERLDLKESVRFLGTLDRPALSREYAHAHMFICPSLYEGYGLVNLEASYFGLPIVMSNTGCARELGEKSSACVVADIALPHDELRSSSDVVRYSTQPPASAIRTLSEKMELVHANYAEYAIKALDAIDRPPFDTGDGAGASMRRFLQPQA